MPEAGSAVHILSQLFKNAPAPPPGSPPTGPLNLFPASPLYGLCLAAPPGNLTLLTG